MYYICIYLVLLLDSFIFILLFSNMQLTVPSSRTLSKLIMLHNRDTKPQHIYTYKYIPTRICK